MLRRFKFLAAIFVVAVVLFQLNRVVFILVNMRFAEGCSLSELFEACLHGLSLDFTTAGYLTALPLLATLVTIWLSGGKRAKRIWRYLFICYFALVLTTIAVIHAADIGMFEAWQSRIDAQVLIYSPSEMLASVTWGMAALALLYVAITVLPALWVLHFAVGRWFDADYQAMPRFKPIYSRMAATAVMILLAGALFVVVRGGLTTATANVSKAYFSPKMFLNQAAINPVFSFVSTLFSGDDFDEYDFYDAARAEQLFAEAMVSGVAVEKSQQWLNVDKPNVIIIIVEGMGRTITDASEGGNEVTPNINRLKSEGIWFERAYASSFRTDRGTVAVLSGFPAQPKMSIMKYPNKAAKLPGIARTMRDAGYATRFFYGGDANFTNTKAYLYATGYDEVVDEDVAEFSGHTSKWGYADDAVLDYAADAILKRMARGGRSLDVILTLSSHEPFKVPYRRLRNDMLNSFAFTDDCIGRFVERMRESAYWDNTLIVLLPDHGYPYPSSVGVNTPARHHIPMLWLGGAVAEPLVVEDCVAQTDLAATLLAQLGLNHDDFIFSRDLSSASTSRFGYWAYNNGFGIIDSLGVTIYDCNASSSMRSECDSLQLREQRGKAFLQKTFMEIRSL